MNAALEHFVTELRAWRRYAEAVAVDAPRYGGLPARLGDLFCESNNPVREKCFDLAEIFERVGWKV